MERWNFIRNVPKENIFLFYMRSFFFFHFWLLYANFYNSSFFFILSFIHSLFLQRLYGTMVDGGTKREFFSPIYRRYNHAADCDFSTTNDPRSYYCHFAKSGTRHGFFGLEIFSTAGFALPRGSGYAIN